VGCRQHVPVWHERTAKWVKDGKLVLLGITQEQHADRCRLFAQWRGLTWPILHDPINLMGSTGVPILVAIDEHGIVRQVEPTLEKFEKEFIDKKFADDAPPLQEKSAKPDIDLLRRRAKATPAAGTWRRLGDALALWGGAACINEALDAYGRALKLEPKHGPTHFRFGVCCRRRFESKDRQSGDFQAAVDAWGKALALDPNQYIWRRRIQQYGPRLDKPYAFYDWVEQAVKDIKKRGDKSVPLTVPPQGAELAKPVRRIEEQTTKVKEPDPEGKIHRDNKGLIGAEVTVVPARVLPGKSARVHVSFRPDDKRKAHWNNESGPLQLWIDVPEGWEISKRSLTAGPADKPESREERKLEFEAKAPPGASGRVVLKAYALYYVCEDVGGKCLFLRRDLKVAIEVGK